MRLSLITTGENYRGDYDAGLVYLQGDVVAYNEKVYRAKVDGFSGVAPPAPEKWDIRVDIDDDVGLVRASDTVEVSETTTNDGVGTRKYWFGDEWILDEPEAGHVRLKKIYQNCDCNCNCISQCNCTADQPNCQNCSYDTGDGLACNCACLFSSNCNYASGHCNCTSNCDDGNCYI